MRTGIVVAVLAIVALIAFNPTMEDFRLFVRQHTETIISQQAGGGPLGDMVAQWGGRFAGENVDRITDRTNYLLFSTYTIDFDGPDRSENEWRFIGIAGQFIETHRPETLRN
jgi:hypothetical protein